MKGLEKSGPFLFAKILGHFSSDPRTSSASITTPVSHINSALNLLPSLLMKKKKILRRKPIRSDQVPATSAMLYEMEERLNHRMDSGFHSMRSEIHRIGLLVEEQNACNKYALDGYAQLYDLLKTKDL